MAGARERGRIIRDYIISQVRDHEADIAQRCASHFGISRQAANKHLNRLVADGLSTAEGATRNRRYTLAVLETKTIVIPLTEGTEEDRVWRTEVEPLFSDLPRPAWEIWQYGVTEMLNNAIDHSSGTQATMRVTRTAADARVILMDDGEGIFRKVTRELQLSDELHALLELKKGKLTTDPERHTGEGIFFTSRMFDAFNILSHQVFFSHDHATDEDWLLPLNAGESEFSGTMVLLELSHDTTKTAQAVFNEYTEDGDYGFTKTVVPVNLVQYGDEALVSRSQAKRLLARFDRFRTVVLDFSGVEWIGQAFADEVFRVYARAHADVEIVPVNVNPQVDAMIRRAAARADVSPSDRSLLNKGVES